MESLDKIYKDQLDAIKNSIQESEELALYLDEEEDEQYKALIEKYENQIHELHEQVAKDKPLQLISFEQEVLDPGYEGLYLSKILGYSVLRGRISDQYKYIRPQDHFRSVLDGIIQSSNFDQIRQRVGQSIQMGFALSSDIWGTNFIASMSNKKVKAFLESQKLHKYRELNIRRTALVKYRKQFQSLHFYTADFPKDESELNVKHDELKDFLIYRSKNDFDDATLTSHINNFISDDKLQNNKHYAELLMLMGLYFDCDKSSFNNAFDKLRATDGFSDKYFSLLRTHWNENQNIEPAAEKNYSQLINKDTTDVISDYYRCLDMIHNMGYIHEDAIQAVRDFYYKQEGLSDENACLRETILAYYRRLLNNLPESEYGEYFEIHKTITSYIEIFSNQQFNQTVKDIALKYVKRLLKVHVDKRGKDYQDIKKFVKTTFEELGFMTPKELVELFKTKRKKKVASS